MESVIEVAIGVAVEQKHGVRRVLIARRPEESTLGGCWEFPGGKIEPGETPEHCVVREFREELGLLVRVDQPVTVIEHKYPHGRVRLHVFYCTRRSGRPCNLRVSEHRWVLPRCLPEYPFPPANESLVDQLVVDLAVDSGD